MRHFKIVLVLFFYSGLCYGQTNFNIIGANNKTMKFTQSELNQLKIMGLKIGESGDISTNISFFEYEKNNPFENTKIILKNNNLTLISQYKNLFSWESKIVVDSFGNESKKIDAMKLKPLILRIKEYHLENCNSDNYIYEIASVNELERYTKNGFEIDLENDFRTHAYEKIKNKIIGTWYTYSIDGFHNIESKRDYAALFKDDREKIHKWVYIKDKELFSYKENSYKIQSKNSCNTKQKILNQIVLLCNLSEKRDIILVTN